MFERLKSAYAIAERSPDPSTKVGAVIVALDTVQGVGWNQFPPGVPESWWNIRDLKYKAVVHAEAAAIIAAGERAKGSVMYVTHHPCRDCAKLIAAAGIKMVFCPADPWRDDNEVRRTCEDARELLDLAGVEVIHHREGELL